jgi:hypothetical protein
VRGKAHLDERLLLHDAPEQQRDRQKDQRQRQRVVQPVQQQLERRNRRHEGVDFALP